MQNPVRGALAFLLLVFTNIVRTKSWGKIGSLRQFLLSAFVLFFSVPAVFSNKGPFWSAVILLKKRSPSIDPKNTAEEACT